jgi:hypothetical protein
VRTLALIAGLGAAAAAHAELYRWIDPASGSIKYSSVPPPWHGDAARERGAPAVEVIPSRAAPRLEPQRAAVPSNPLEARWRAELESLARTLAASDVQGVDAARGRLEAFQALSAELDRVDPEGRDRRRADAERVLRSARR